MPAVAALGAVSAARLSVRDPEPLEALYDWLAGPRRDPPVTCRCCGRLVRLAGEAVRLLHGGDAPRAAVSTLAVVAVQAAVEHAGPGILLELRQEVVRACLGVHERGVRVV